MKRMWLLSALVLSTLVPALPADAGFRSLANEIGTQHGLKRVRIPFLGIGRIFVRFAQPDGVHDVKIAVFEDRGGASAVDLPRLVRRHIDPDAWSPMIRASSKGEDTHIFIQEHGDNIRLLIAARDHGEIVVIEVELDAERFARELADDGDFISIGRGD